MIRNTLKGSHRQATPPLPSHSHSHLHHPQSNRPIILLALVLSALFGLSLLSHPDPSAGRKLQFPGLLPTKPPHPAHLKDQVLERAINQTYEAFKEACPGSSGIGVHLNPDLTASQKKRYEGLKGHDTGRYMLVTNTRQIEAHLPDLLNTLLVLLHYLSPEHIAVSILEGPSSDCTQKVIEDVLQPMLAEQGLGRSWMRIETGEHKIDWSQYNRIEKIAELRNRALEPLWEGVGDEEWSKEVEAVVFFNDVYLHAADVLEVLYQHQQNGAGITTALDWWKKRPEYYYDVWVGRTIDKGDLFYPIDWPWWSPSSDLFSSPTASTSKNAYTHLQPFQVFSSWNALAVLDPRPFLEHGVRFRRGDLEKGECAASECTLVASDFWKEGFGKIAVVPSVQLAYERDVAQDVLEDLNKQKAQIGWVDGVPPDHLDEKLEWRNHPPEKVRCHPWPETNGLSANVWENTEWVKPWLD
ncbi:alpha-1,3-mannosyltransferase CMT1 [Cryptococcus floricola]|uniref:Alpha-1,3-mannosyltransferase CMT1 n=1 Tax=Cryptococcus floricola TaxID=2591691 RepID=A0A5D3B991_9TREE|nr:alpha-1,3-mannosyltransferase CMT1 [Cryptococcus floricola]